MKRIPLQTLFLCLSLSTTPLVSVSAAENWFVTPDQAACILEHKKDYLAQNLDVIVIPVENCPDTQLFADPLGGKQNMATPKIPTQGTSSRVPQTGADTDQVIMYTSRQLECLQSDMVVFEDDRAILPRAIECD